MRCCHDVHLLTFPLIMVESDTHRVICVHVLQPSLIRNRNNFQMNDLWLLPWGDQWLIIIWVNQNIIYNEGANLLTVVFDWFDSLLNIFLAKWLVSILEGTEMGFTNTDGFRYWGDKIIREVWGVKREVSFTPLLRFKYLHS